MPKYSRNVTVSGKSAAELYDAVQRDIDRFLSKTPLGKYDLERDPDLQEVRFKSSMASMTLSFDDGMIRFEGTLSFMALPFKTKLDEGIDKWLAKTFSVS